MTSEERHEARYLRRKQKREEKRHAKLGKYDDFSKVSDLNSLYKAYKKSRKGVRWKASVQRYEMNYLKNIKNTHDKLENEEDVRRGFIFFDLLERGKLRHIASVHFSERVVQRSLCDNSLVPMLSNSLIYDNGASLQGKGIDFALDRCSVFLQKHFRKYGTEGYVLSVDFSKYFENIPHEHLFKLIDENFTDEKLKNLTKKFIEAFGDKGLGIGSQISQVLAISFMNKIDHFIKEVLRVKSYIRYMDDSLFIVKTKEEAVKILNTLRKLYAEFGIIVNERKTKIIKLSHGFTFLKTKFFVTETGKIVKKICHRSVVVMRRKLKKFKKLLDEGKMTYQQIVNAYESWKGYAKHKNTYKTRLNMSQLFNKLFIDNWYKPATC